MSDEHSESSSDDSKILNIARELCNSLGIEATSLETLSWQEAYGSFPEKDRRGNYLGRPVTPHFPIFYKSKLIISPVLNGRLQPEEYRPLLASSLYFEKKLSRTRNLGMLLRFAPLLAAASLLIPALFLKFPILQDSIVLFVFIGIFLVAGAAGVYTAIRLSRTLVLVADVKSSETTGRQSLINVLEKLESLRQLDERFDEDWPEYGDHPSIARRMENLKQST